MPTETRPVPPEVAGAADTVTVARCLDCGSALIGRYCHVCGQAAASRIVPLRALAGAAIEDTVGVDGRLVRTLRLLFAKPGAATLEFLAGRRTRYVPPFRLYLIASLVYFVMLEVSGSTRFMFFQATGDPEGFGQFVRLLPRLMFLLLPSFALLLLLLFRRGRRLYAEHVVFALHFHAVAFLVLSIDAAVFPLLRPVPDGMIDPVVVAASVVAAAAQFYVLIHLYLALRRVYGRSRFSTAVRAGALLVGYGIVLGVAGVLSVPWLRRILWNLLTGAG
jgi:hypothetical protein